jgi:hypothetical protein
MAYTVEPQRYAPPIPSGETMLFAPPTPAQNPSAPGDEVLAAASPAFSDSADCMQTWGGWGEDEASAASKRQERIEFFPPPVPPVQTRRQSQLSEQRSERPYAAPGKPTRPKKILKPGKQTPA